MTDKLLLQRARWALEGTDPDLTPLTSAEHAALVADLKAAAEDLRPEESIAKNAARYQWLKDANVDVMDEILMQKAEEWDSLIDTQIAFEERVPQEQNISKQSNQGETP